MIWVPDKTGRFPQRPHYEPQELDHECQGIVTDFLQQKHGTVKFPISTDDIAVIIEHDTSDLDLYANLSSDGEDVEGATDFYKDRKPVVLINKDLSEQQWREHRLRTTLAHEYGHVRFHAFLWNFYRPKLIPSPEWEKGPRCTRKTILTLVKSDWMEWQASYISGAILIPITYLRQIVGDFLRENGLYKFVKANSPEANTLVQRISDAFNVSRDAAMVRLSQQGYLSKADYSMPLF